MVKRDIIYLILLFLLNTSTSVYSDEIADPDPLRFSQEIDAFELWDLKNSFPENALLFAGSSSIRLWHTHEAFPEYPVINRGFGGAHISDILYFYDRVILKYRPSLIFFYCGDNDVAYGKTVGQVLEDYKELVNKLKTDLPRSMLVYLAIKPSGSRWNFWQKMQEVNRRIEEFNKRDEDLYYIDTATPLTDLAGIPDSSFFLEDRLHLNSSGYDLWNDAVRKFLDKTFER